tara:strand:+ start:833 stop:1210 length:378 start_codon:yes stop_codon:yes gene_type:complete
MKKALILSITALLIAAPLAQAQAQTRGDHRMPQAQTELKHNKSKPVLKSDHKKPQVQYKANKPAHHKHWAKGQRMNDWKKRSVVNDYQRHGLHRPGQGQRWVKVDNQYVLVSIASGLIASIVSGR